MSNTSYNNEGKVVLFRKKADDNPKKPSLSGSFTAHRDIKCGEKISIAVWHATDRDGQLKKTKSGDSYFSGNISDPFSSSTQPQKGSIVEEAIKHVEKSLVVEDDEIPF